MPRQRMKPSGGRNRIRPPPVADEGSMRFCEKQVVQANAQKHADFEQRQEERFIARNKEFEAGVNRRANDYISRWAVQIPPSPFIHKYPFWCLCAGKTDWELLLGGEFPVCLFLCHKRIRLFCCILLTKSVGNRYVEGFFPIFFISLRNVNVIN